MAKQIKTVFDTETFITKANHIHDNMYDYSLVAYKNNAEKVKIKCSEHGIFEQRPSAHLRGQGCPEHGRLYVIKNIRLSIDEFLNRSNKKHRHKYYYFLVDYKDVGTKVIILCSKHGDFKQTPSKHMSGQGCPKCARELPHYNELTTELFIKKAKKIHGNKYDYSLVDYKRSCIKVKIICKEHGLFEQIPNNHIRGMKCLKCANEESGDKRKLNIQIFIDRSRKVHRDTYDYSVTEYNFTDIKVKIKCYIHGIFEQTPNAHWRGQGCPICDESHGERVISQFLDSMNIIYEREKTFEQCKHKHKLFFDFYIPSLNTCIEYDGRQHYFSSEYFGGIPALELLKKADAIKANYCLNQGINLLRITYKKNTVEAIEAMLKEELFSVMM